MNSRTKKIHEGSQFRAYLKHAPWYFISSLLSKALGFLLLPVYTRYLSPEDYGVLATLQSYGVLASVVISLSMDSAFIRYYYQERVVSESRVQRLYSTFFWFIVCWGVFASGAMLFVTPLVMTELLDISLLPVVLVIAAQLLNQLSLMVLRIWRAELLARRIALITVVNSIITAGITLYLLIPHNAGWMAQIYATASIASLQALLLVWIAIQKNWLKFDFDQATLKKGIIYALPLMPSVAASWISGYSDRMILSYYGHIAQAGLYSIAFQFAYILYIFSDAVTQIQEPISMSGLTSDRERAKEQIVEFIRVYIWMMTLIYLGMTLFSREVIEWFLDPRYREAYRLIAILSFLYIIGGLYRIFTVIISFHKKTWIIASAAILQAIVNVMLNFTFIPLFGMYAAAWSSLFSLLGYFFWLVFWSQRLEPIKIPWDTIGIVFAGALSTLVVWRFIDSYELGLVVFLLKLMLVAAFIGVTLSSSSLDSVRRKVMILAREVQGRF